MGPNIIIEEEEEDKFYQWANQYIQWDSTLYKPVSDVDVKCSHKLNLDNPLFNLTKIKGDGTSKTSVISKLS